MKVAISLALVGTIVGEFVAAQHGLGYVILAAQGVFDTNRVFVALLLLAIMGTLLFYFPRIGGKENGPVARVATRGAWTHSLMGAAFGPLLFHLSRDNHFSDRRPS